MVEFIDSNDLGIYGKTIISRMFTPNIGRKLNKKMNNSSRIFSTRFLGFALLSGFYRCLQEEERTGLWWFLIDACSMLSSFFFQLSRIIQRTFIQLIVVNIFGMLVLVFLRHQCTIQIMNDIEQKFSNSCSPASQKQFIQNLLVIVELKVKTLIHFFFLAESHNYGNQWVNYFTSVQNR